MYAIVAVGGHQFQVQEGTVLRVPRLSVEPGTTHSLTDVLLLRTEEGTRVGRPQVTGAVVAATVVRHGRGDKVVIFKMKRRKGYRRRTGHRQDYTELKITGIAVPN